MSFSRSSLCVPLGKRGSSFFSNKTSVYVFTSRVSCKNKQLQYCMCTKRILFFPPLSMQSSSSCRFCFFILFSCCFFTFTLFSQIISSSFSSFFPVSSIAFPLCISFLHVFLPLSSYFVLATNLILLSHWRKWSRRSLEWALVLQINFPLVFLWIAISLPHILSLVLSLAPSVLSNSSVFISSYSASLSYFIHLCIFLFVFEFSCVLLKVFRVFSPLLRFFRSLELKTEIFCFLA